MEPIPLEPATESCRRKTHRHAGLAEKAEPPGRATEERGNGVSQRHQILRSAFRWLRTEQLPRVIPGAHNGQVELPIRSQHASDFRYSPGQIEGLLKLAAKYNLITTGGSDFHGLDTLNEPQLGMVEVPLESAEALIALAGRN